MSSVCVDTPRRFLPRHRYRAGNFVLSPDGEVVFYLGHFGIGATMGTMAVVYRLRVREDFELVAGLG